MIKLMTGKIRTNCDYFMKVFIFNDKKEKVILNEHFSNFEAFLCYQNLLNDKGMAKVLVENIADELKTGNIGFFGSIFSSSF